MVIVVHIVIAITVHSEANQAFVLFLSSRLKFR